MQNYCDWLYVYTFYVRHQITNPLNSLVIHLIVILCYTCNTVSMSTTILVTEKRICHFIALLKVSLAIMH
jgi:hypothetical protein